MRFIIYSIVPFLLGVSLGFSQTNSSSSSILFVGDGLTYYHDLPQAFEALAEAAGKSVRTVSQAGPGYSLYRHSQDTETLRRLIDEKWDVVILQEQHEISIIPYHRKKYMIPSARRLDSLVDQQGARTLLFVNWAHPSIRKHCQRKKCSKHFKTARQELAAITESYQRVAAEINAELTPIGQSWLRAQEVAPDIPLWEDENELYPSVYGNYLNACVFYKKIFQESPEGIPYYPNDDPEKGKVLQKIVAEMGW